MKQKIANLKPVKNSQLSIVPTSCESQGNCQRLSQRGFTLIELMVSIVLIFVMTAAILPSMNNYSQFIEVRQEAQKLKTLLLDAQGRAGGNLNECGIVESTTAYGIYFNQTNESFEMTAYKGKPAPIESCGPAIKTYNKSPGIEILINGTKSQINILFDVPKVLPGTKVVRWGNPSGYQNDANKCINSLDLIVRSISNPLIQEKLTINCLTGVIEVTPI